jgi:hypothetical protein
VSPSSDSTAGLSSSELRLAFEKFMQTYASSSGGRVLTNREREMLFAKFKESLTASREQAFAH